MACIDSLRKLKYSENLLEIFIVNDKSTDNTFEVSVKASEGSNIKVINSRDHSTTNLRGKPNAIDTAIEQSKGEIILMTDADCIVNENWVEEISSYYDDKTLMVCGFTKQDRNHKLFTSIQTIDWMYLQGIASGSCGIGSALSCIGNNLSFRKEAYYRVGGYENIKFSITEDLAILKNIKALANDSIRYPISPDSSVSSEECLTLRQLYLQKKRWFKGGAGISIFGYVLGLSMYLSNILFLAGWIFLPIFLYVSLIAVKFISDLMIILPVNTGLKFKGYIKYYIIFEFYFMIYGLLLPFTFIFGYKVQWKGRKL